MDGLWSSPDLPALLRFAAVNRASLALAEGWWRVPVQLQRTLAHRARRNSKDQARRNISAHYDLGNDFYRLFLDESMTYSSAVFESPDQTLADAQRNKYRLMAEGAGLRAGQHVLEIGSGWGGFALYAAGELGCRVTSITISAGAARPRHRTGARGRPGPPRRHPAARLPRHRGDVRRHRLDRDARGRRRGVLHDLLRGVRPGAGAGRPAQPPVDHVPRRRLRDPASRRELDPDVHLPGRPLPVAGRHRAIHPRHGPAHHGRPRHRRRATS